MVIHEFSNSFEDGAMVGVRAYAILVKADYYVDLALGTIDVFFLPTMLHDMISYQPRRPLFIHTVL